MHSSVADLKKALLAAGMVRPLAPEPVAATGAAPHTPAVLAKAKAAAEAEKSFRILTHRGRELYDWHVRTCVEMQPLSPASLSCLSLLPLSPVPLSCLSFTLKSPLPSCLFPAPAFCTCLPLCTCHAAVARVLPLTSWLPRADSDVEGVQYIPQYNARRRTEADRPAQDRPGPSPPAFP